MKHNADGRVESTPSRTARHRLARIAVAALLGTAALAASQSIALAVPYGELSAPPVAESDDYVGWWCPADEAASVIAVDGKAYQLQIVGQTEDYLVFSIMCTTSGAEVGSANAMGTLVAPIVDGTATFSMCDGQGRIYDGSIALADGALDVSIAQTGSYQTTSPYPAENLSVEGPFARDAHHVAKTDSIGWTESQLQPSSSSEPLNEEMLVYMSPLLLELTRNEIYARHGYVFQTDYLAQYFSAKSWYEPLDTGETFDESCLNDVERSNVELLQRIQQRWESMSNGTTFIGTSGSYAPGYYGTDVQQPESPISAEVSFDEQGCVTIALDGEGVRLPDAALTARIVDDATAVLDVDGGQIVANWYGPGYFFFSWRGAQEVPEAWADLVYQNFRNDAYVAVG